MNLTNITIDFEQSHLFFPKIIITLLVILLALILIVNVPKLMKKENKFRFFEENYDKLKLWGTIILIMVYFKGMEVVGSFFPNMGYGFLFTSIPFMAIISYLYIGQVTKRKLIYLAASSIITPTLVWYVFGNLFNISLP